MSDARRQYVIGLGANLGDRLATLKSAVRCLRELGELKGLSALYETAAVGPPQPDFLNAAVLLETTLDPSALLNELLRIERLHGRERRERWGPRTLDLDLLFSPELVLDEPHLTLPHPELARRAFALAPLVDVLAGAAEPRSETLYRELLQRASHDGLRQVETKGSWCPGWAE
jgi:2-amino-4-hydroxy-6-hydroxymethyldihydropteridine diphosphokinase